MAGLVTQIGESFVGEGQEAAHLNTVLGHKGGPVETAWVTALATPRQGYAAFVTVVAPGLAVKPLTLFVNKAEIADEQHARLTWGAAQAGVAAGVLQAVADDVISSLDVDDLLLVAAVWVNPKATREGAVYENNHRATRLALEAGLLRTPSVDELMAIRDRPRNPFFAPPDDAD